MKYEVIFNILLSFTEKATRILKKGSSAHTADLASEETHSEDTFEGPSLD